MFFLSRPKIHTFTQDNYYCLSNNVSVWAAPSFIKSNDLIKVRATQTETSLLKQYYYVAGESVDLLDDYDFPARTITEIISIMIGLVNSEDPWLQARHHL